MTAMAVLIASGMAVFKIVGTLIFVGVFVAVVVRLLLSRSDRYKKAAQMPLEDEKIIEPREGALDDEAKQDTGSDPNGK
jgi:hypothetical protein